MHLIVRKGNLVPLFMNVRPVLPITDELFGLCSGADEKVLYTPSRWAYNRRPGNFASPLNGSNVSWVSVIPTIATALDFDHGVAGDLHRPLTRDGSYVARINATHDDDSTHVAGRYRTYKLNQDPWFKHILDNRGQIDVRQLWVNFANAASRNKTYDGLITESVNMTSDDLDRVSLSLASTSSDASFGLPHHVPTSSGNKAIEQAIVDGNVLIPGVYLITKDTIKASVMNKIFSGVLKADRQRDVDYVQAVIDQVSGSFSPLPIIVKESGDRVLTYVDARLISPSVFKSNDTVKLSSLVSEGFLDYTCQDYLGPITVSNLLTSLSVDPSTLMNTDLVDLSSCGLPLSILDDISLSSLVDKSTATRDHTKWDSECLTCFVDNLTSYTDGALLLSKLGTFKAWLDRDNISATFIDEFKSFADRKGVKLTIEDITSAVAIADIFGSKVQSTNGAAVSVPAGTTFYDAIYANESLRPSIRTGLTSLGDISVSLSAARGGYATIDIVKDGRTFTLRSAGKALVSARITCGVAMLALCEFLKASATLFSFVSSAGRIRPLVYSQLFDGSKFREVLSLTVSDIDSIPVQNDATGDCRVPHLSSDPLLAFALCLLGG